MEPKNYRRQLAIGDIHGNFRSMKQALSRAGFDPENDLLIALGDFTDGYDESFEVVQCLLQLDHFIGIKGNHDVFVNQWLMSEGRHVPELWLTNRGQSTMKSFLAHSLFENQTRLNKFQTFFKNLRYYFLSDNNQLFVHGGLFPLTVRAEENNRPHEFCTDRTMWQTALRAKKSSNHVQTKRNCFSFYDTIFIGHTPTYNSSNHSLHPDAKPMKALNVINLDTGGGWNGKVTVMDVDSTQYWQSDFRSREGVM